MSSTPHAVSFAGCGFQATYQLGVAQCLLTQTPWILHAAPLVLGASSGSLVAAAVVCGLKLPAVRDELLQFAGRLNAVPLGPLNPSVNAARWMEAMLRKHLPDDAHTRARGRLGVAITQLSGQRKTLVTDFQSKEEVVQALLCSCFVPGYSGMVPPFFRGVRCVDGGFTSMVPLLAPPSRTLSVSPFSGDADICPRGEPSALDMVVSGAVVRLNQANRHRLLNALYPSDMEGLEKAYHRGYKDANHFLQNTDLSTFLTKQHLSALNRYLSMKEVLRLDAPSDEEEDEEEQAEEEEEEGEGEGEEEMFWRTSLTDKNDNMWWTDTASVNKLSARPLKQAGFPALNRALLLYLSFMSGWGSPTALSLLLLPLNLPYFLLLNKEMLVWVFWAAVGFLQMSLFGFQMLVFSVQKNVTDRLLPVLQGLNIQAEYERPGPDQDGVWYSSLGLHFTRSGPTREADPVSSGPDSVRSSVWLHLECDKEEEVSGRRRYPQYQSVMG